MSTRRRPRSTTAPMIDPVDPADLEPGEATELTAGRGDLTGRTYADLDLDTLDLTGRDLDGCRLDGLTVGRWGLTGSAVVEVVGDRLDVTTLDAHRPDWRDVVVHRSRIGSAELTDGRVRSVRFTGCKIGFLNLRGSEVADVEFVDCAIEDLDLVRADVTRVAFAGSRIGRLDLTGSTLRDLDLRGADLGDLVGWEELRGVTVSTAQLHELAPLLAERLGIRVDV
ncbi:pentapeptide repeat-containing protein [Raineyella sp. LH-20]|uniref:pentapeptide repeat-containing protein n=1 Tax=Raineyella sp. LH-20 TaxID=3081204 RepID=UPI00295363E4|nr:pentapeptide repeat-containing protein [Raineyella sp. LH-20]WOP17757.1 hypothetical protein R0146_10875 [Raineyella sp. LH-20]